MSRVLVTGGAGFIGSHLVDALVKEGHQVRVLDNLEPQVHEGRKPAYLNPAVDYEWGDVRDRDAVRRALGGIEVVFHEAAAVGVGQSMYQIDKYVSANGLGTAVLLDVIVAERLPIQKLVVASSMSLYGEGHYRCAACGPVLIALRPAEQLAESHWEPFCPRCRTPVTAQPTPEDKPLLPTSVYAISKRDQEELCLTVGAAHKIPAVALRYFNVYGSRQALSNPYTGVCAIFSARIKHGKPPLLFEDGRQSRDFIHVSDIVQANLLVMREARADGQVFNVGTGVATSILDVARALIRCFGATVEPRAAQQFRAGDIRHCYANIQRLHRLGFSPKVALADGLQELVAWGQREGAEDRVEVATQELTRFGLVTGHG